MTTEEDKPAFYDHDRFKKEYIKFGSIVLGELERFASEKPEETHWYQTFFDPYILWDGYLSFSSEIELLPDDIRKGDVTNIDCRQLRELLRCNYLYEKVVMVAATEVEEELGKDAMYKEINARIVAHPLWKRMAAQSRKTLDLLRIKS
jgi:hypothetical protein